MTNRHTELCIIQGDSVTPREYVNEELKPQDRLFMSAVGPEFLLMYDTARQHLAYVLPEYWQTDDITRMDWPPCSPDLRLIENAADFIPIPD